MLPIGVPPSSPSFAHSVARASSSWCVSSHSFGTRPPANSVVRRLVLLLPPPFPAPPPQGNKPGVAHRTPPLATSSSAHACACSPMMAPMDGISTCDPPRRGEPFPPAELTPPRRPSRRFASPQKAAARASLATGSPALTAATGASKTTHSPLAMDLVATTRLSPGSPVATHASQPGPKSRAARCRERCDVSASSSESEPEQDGPSGRIGSCAACSSRPACSSFVAVGSSAVGASAAGSSTTGTVTLSW